MADFNDSCPKYIKVNPQDIFARYMRDYLKLSVSVTVPLQDKII